MRTILTIIQKEFLQIFRNRMMLPIIFIVPIVQLLILVHAATFEMKNIRMAVVDKDLSTTSRKLISKFAYSPFFMIVSTGFSVKEAEHEMKNGNCDFILHIPSGSERELIRYNKCKLQLIINAINGVAAGLINAYAISVIFDYNREILTEAIPINIAQMPSEISITYSHWYNPELNYKTYMVPGVLVLLVTIISMLLTALNIIREKEMGTIEQINVTPVEKYQFIIGKLLPFLLLALFDLAFGLSIGKLVFDIPIVGNLCLLFGIAVVYVLVTLGIGLFISTLANTQQQAIFISFFFMIIFILMSGLFTPVESMPDWAHWLNIINPVAYFIKIIRMILLKGSGFGDILNEFFSLLVYGLIILSLAVWRYRKTI